MAEPSSQKPTVPDPRSLPVSDESLRALFNSLPDLFFILSSTGDFLACHTTDPTWQSIAPDQFLGKNVREVLPREAAERMIISGDRVRLTGQIETLEFPWPIAGALRHVECRLTAYDGERLLALVRDITAHKQLEAEVRAQEQLLENLLAVARTIYERPTVHATLQNALEIALALTGATGGDLNWLDRSGMVTHSIFSGSLGIAVAASTSDGRVKQTIDSLPSPEKCVETDVPS